MSLALLGVLGVIYRPCRCTLINRQNCAPIIKLPVFNQSQSSQILIIAPPLTSPPPFHRYGGTTPVPPLTSPPPSQIRRDDTRTTSNFPPPPSTGTAGRPAIARRALDGARLVVGQKVLLQLDDGGVPVGQAARVAGRRAQGVQGPRAELTPADGGGRHADGGRPGQQRGTGHQRRYKVRLVSDRWWWVPHKQTNNGGLAGAVWCVCGTGLVLNPLPRWHKGLAFMKVFVFDWLRLLSFCTIFVFND